MIPTKFTPIPFIPPFWLKNAHIQTILPKLFAPKCPIYRRELVKDSLNENDVAYDFFDAPSDKADTKPIYTNKIKNKIPIVVLFHGMEGSSDSHYARALAYQVHAQGWHFVVAHFRSCGGVPVKSNVFYNAGDTTEIAHCLNYLANQYQTIFAIGVSLGGNALAKYLGDYADKAVCHGAVVVSAPVDLTSASIAMERFLGQKIYTPYLLKPIIKKALVNQLDTEQVKAIKQCQKLSDFDQVFTAPQYGFRSKNDYYYQSSALPTLIYIKTPTLIISAKDDPFLGVVATQDDVSNQVQLLYPKHGGHIGFLRYQNGQFNINWLPESAISFLSTINYNNHL